MPGLNVAELYALRTADFHGQVTAPWTNRMMIRLVDRKLLVEMLLRTPAGELSAYRLFVITDAGRRAIKDAGQ